MARSGGTEAVSDGLSGAGVPSRRGVWAIVAVVALVAAGGGGYAVGNSGGTSGHRTTTTASQAPAKRAPKPATGSRGDYHAGFSQGRNSAYRSAYRKAYLAAFRKTANGGK